MPSKSIPSRSNTMADQETGDLFVGDLKSLRSMVTCKVCFKMLYEPYTLGCGHTFCYSCLCTWFETNRFKKTCPKCRSRVEQQPAPSYVIKEIVNLFVTRGLLSTEETPEEQARLRAQESRQLERDKANKHELTGGIFRGCFRPRFSSSMRIIRDIDDGVDRCPFCSWEVESLVCQRCHLHFDETGRILDSMDESTDDDPDHEDGFPAFPSDEELDEDVDLEDDEDELFGAGRSLDSGVQQQQDDSHDERSLYRSYHGAGLEDEDDDGEGSEGSLRDFIDYETGEEPDPETSSDEAEGIIENAGDASSTDDALRPRTHTRRAAVATSEVSVDSDEGGAVLDGRRRRRPQGSLHALPSHLGSARAADGQPALDGNTDSHTSTTFGSRFPSFRLVAADSDTDDEPVVAGPPGRSRNSTSGQRKRVRRSSNPISDDTPSPRASMATTGNHRRAIGATGPSRRATGRELSSLTRQTGRASYSYTDDSDGDVSMADSMTTGYPQATGQSQSNPIDVDNQSSSDESVRAPRRRRHISSDDSAEIPQQLRQRRQRVRSSLAGVEIPSGSGARRPSGTGDPGPPRMSPAPARFGARHRHSVLSRTRPMHEARRHSPPDESSRTRLDLDSSEPW